MKEISWKTGLKSACSFGFSGILLMLFSRMELDLGLLLLIIPSGTSGLIFSYLLQKQLQNRCYFLISPVIITAGLLFSIIAYLTVQTLLPIEISRSNFQFFLMSGLLCSSILGVLFVLSHPIKNKIKTMITAIICCTGLSLGYGATYEFFEKESFVWIAATVWLMVFGLTVGLQIKETGASSFQGRF